MSIHEPRFSSAGNRTTGQRKRAGGYPRRPLDPKDQLGISRNIEDYKTKRELLAVRNRLRLRGSPKRLHGMRLHVVESGETFAAIRPSGILELLGPDKFMQAVEAETAPVVSATRTVPTTGLHQFGEWVGVGLEYPRFVDARTLLTSTISRLAGREIDWAEMDDPHIRLGMGDLSQLQEEASTVVVPPYINLARTAFGPPA